MMKFGVTITLLLPVLMLALPAFGGHVRSGFTPDGHVRSGFTPAKCKREIMLLNKRIAWLDNKLKDTRCHYGGKTYYDEQEFASDCNTCVCENGVVACTNNPCNQDCQYSGTTYPHGAHFPSEGGCFECTCDNGDVECTKELCQTEPLVKQATQSSEDDNDIRPAELALDNTINTISHTSDPVIEVGEYPWWMVEYACPHTFIGVRIWNRNCCGAGLGNITFYIDGQECGKIINDYPGDSASKTITCNKPLKGTSLKIQKDEVERLFLGEVDPIFSCP